MQFLVKIVKDCESRGIFRTQQNIKMELFAEKVNGFQPFIIFVKSAILDVLNTEYCSEYVSGSVNYFRKKLHLRCLTRFYIYLWHKVVSSFGRNFESSYIEWLLSRVVLEEICFGNLILSQIYVRNILSQ